MIRLILRNKFANAFNQFSTKKPLQKGPLKISRFKLDQALGGYLIYRSFKQKNFMIVGFGMLGGIVLSVLLYRLQGNIIGFIPMLISLSALAIYQKRLMNTIKQVVIDKTGQKMILQTYGIFGSKIFREQVHVPIYLMKGVSKKKINNAILIQGGGSFGIKKFKYYFHQDGVIDKPVFDYVVSGKIVKYADIL